VQNDAVRAIDLATGDVSTVVPARSALSDVPLRVQLGTRWPAQEPSAPPPRSWWAQLWQGVQSKASLPTPSRGNAAAVAPQLSARTRGSAVFDWDERPLLGSALDLPLALDPPVARIASTWTVTAASTAAPLWQLGARDTGAAAELAAIADHGGLPLVPTLSATTFSTCTKRLASSISKEITDGHPICGAMARKHRRRAGRASGRGALAHDGGVAGAAARRHRAGSVAAGRADTAHVVAAR